MPIRPVSEWFLAEDDPRFADAPVRIVCFPHAGGDPVGFVRWQRQFGEAAQLLGVTTPGWLRSTAADVAELVERAAEAVGSLPPRPTILFGHSLGGLLAFEVARRLRGRPEITDLVASGCAAPCRMPSARVVRVAQLEGREFAEEVAFFGGLPPEVVAAEELYELLLPRLIADFRMVASYRYRSEPPLRIPVHLVNGVDDPHVRGDALTGWEAESVMPVQQQVTAGGHFYFEPDPTFLLGLMQHIAATRSEASSPHIELI